jgi:protein-tyrosine phosphatase
VVFPKETTYSIAADYRDPGAIERLWKVRGIPPETVPVVHLADRDDVGRWVDKLPAQASRLMNKFWPGPLTLLVRGKTAPEIGIRLPSLKLAQDLIRRSGVPLVATQASLSGQPPCVRGDDAVRLFADKVDWIIDRGETRYKNPSTVVRITGPGMEIVREGAISRGLIEESAYRLILMVCTGNTCRSPMAETMARELIARKAGVKPEDLERVSGLRIVSAGTGAAKGQDMTASARQVLEEMGFRPGRHASAPLGFALLEEADQIYVMTGGHREQILDWSPESASKVYLLDPSGRDVEDPIWGDAEVYRDCAMHIRRCIETRMSEI